MLRRIRRDECQASPSEPLAHNLHPHQCITDVGDSVDGVGHQRDALSRGVEHLQNALFRLAERDGADVWAGPGKLYLLMKVVAALGLGDRPD